MKEQLFARKGKVIIDLRDHQVVIFKSLNKAKKESRKLQLEHDAGLGRGSLQVEN